LGEGARQGRVDGGDVIAGGFNESFAHVGDPSCTRPASS
jgi:hypothetical protein